MNAEPSSPKISPFNIVAFGVGILWRLFAILTGLKASWRDDQSRGQYIHPWINPLMFIAELDINRGPRWEQVTAGLNLQGVFLADTVSLLCFLAIIN